MGNRYSNFSIRAKAVSFRRVSRMSVHGPQRKSFSGKGKIKVTGSTCYDHTLSLNDGGDHYKFQENSFHWLARKDSRQRLLRWEYNKLLHFA